MLILKPRTDSLQRPSADETSAPRRTPTAVLVDVVAGLALAPVAFYAVQWIVVVVAYHTFALLAEGGQDDVLEYLNWLPWLFAGFAIAVSLRRENVRLRMERELLKRAVAFWVRESNE